MMSSALWGLTLASGTIFNLLVTLAILTFSWCRRQMLFPLCAEAVVKNDELGCAAKS